MNFSVCQGKGFECSPKSSTAGARCQTIVVKVNFQVAGAGDLIGVGTEIHTTSTACKPGRDCQVGLVCSLRPWLFLVAGLLDDLRPVMKMPKPLPRSSSRRATISEYKRRAQNYVSVPKFPFLEVSPS